MQNRAQEVKFIVGGGGDKCVTTKAPFPEETQYF